MNKLQQAVSACTTKLTSTGVTTEKAPYWTVVMASLVRLQQANTDENKLSYLLSLKSNFKNAQSELRILAVEEALINQIDLNIQQAIDAVQQQHENRFTSFSFK